MKLYLFTIFCILSHCAFAQNSGAIKGSVGDHTSGANLRYTTISVLRAKDSTLVKFTRAGENGTFNISGIQKGKLFLLVTYPGYADYVEQFNLDSSKKDIDFGRIKLTLKATLLADVIIKGKAAAIKIKGDTTEFTASAYQIQPNSKVEDLLKQLPGIQIDKDGKITAQGQKVNKVLVDGEEFFGDDPTLVTKNIRADMVDKVQLFDKKSDQATFTGIDDGKKEKTINIKLKEDKKNGYFGKLDIGGATDKFYQAQSMFNAFKKKQKFSAYGTLGNTGKIGLGWEDNSKYGAGDNIQFQDGGNIFISSNGDDPLDSYNGQYNGEGIPVARTGGLHYDTKWNSDKESINTNYKIGSLAVDGTKSTLSQNNLPSGIINSNSDLAFDSYMFRQKLDATYQVKLDSTSTIKVSADGTAKNGDSHKSYTGSSFSNNLLLNNTSRQVSNDNHDKIFNSNLFWTKKLKKIGRTLSLNVNQAYKESESTGFLKSEIEFFNAKTVPDSIQLIDQYKTNQIKSSVFSTNLAYTEPLTKSLSLILNYGFGLSNSSANRKSFNRSPDGKYSSLDPLYSNNYKLDQVSNLAGAILNFKKNKSIINFGTKIASVNFDQQDVINNSSFKRTFINWNPQASYQYKFSQQKNLRVSYLGNTTQPNIDQIQPVRVNTDPLNIQIGNPDLKSSFNNKIDINYNSYKVLSGQSIYFGGGYNFTSDAIVSSVDTDPTGKSVYKSINLTDHQTSNYYLYSGASRKLNADELYGSVNFNSNGRIYYSYINGSLNKTNSNSYSGQLSISKYKEKKYESRLAFGPTYTTGQSSLQKSVNDNGWGLNGEAYFTIYLPGKFEVGSDVSYEHRSKTQSFNSDFNLVLLNARISKKFLKSEGLKFSLSANDLLNQNVGFNRNANGNMITQTSYTTIKRYFMASITWDFNKMGGGSAKK
ncbi:TonB-dependent receptor [Pedobacter sp. PAMC26386]|nr:TonB-dependent receptor [Pedobacter sp. PAMC26386]